MATWDLQDLEYWDAKIREQAEALGLDCYPQEFEVCNLFGYGEIKPLGSRYYESSMLNIFRRLEADNFQTVLIERKEDIWPSFKAFLARDRGRDQ